MNTVKVPPINLWSYVEAQYLLTRFPLLASTGRADTVESAARIYYTKSDGRRFGTTLRSTEVAK